MSLKVPDGDRKKREYEVVAARPVNRESYTNPSAGRPGDAADPSR